MSWQRNREMPGPPSLRTAVAVDRCIMGTTELPASHAVFEPIWNAVHVDHVDISWLESLTLEGRASYYDRAGVMKDMVQNHLMEAMALVLMGQPARMDAGSFRGVRVEGLRAVATPAVERMRSQTVRGRYTAGTIGTRQVPSYVDGPGVDPSCNTETYACRTLQVNSPR